MKAWERESSGPHRTRGSRGDSADERQGMGAREWQHPHVRCVKCPHIIIYFNNKKKQKTKKKLHFFSLSLYLSLHGKGGSRHVIMSHTYAYHMAHPLPLPTTINQKYHFPPFPSLCPPTFSFSILSTCCFLVGFLFRFIFFFKDD